MATLIKADGTEHQIHPSGKKWSLSELQAAVGGDIEIMPGIRGPKIILNEDGQVRGLSVNSRATRLVLDRLRNEPLRYIPELRGDVLFLEPADRI